MTRKRNCIHKMDVNRFTLLTIDNTSTSFILCKTNAMDVDFKFRPTGTTAMSSLTSIGTRISTPQKGFSSSPRSAETIWISSLLFRKTTDFSKLPKKNMAVSSTSNIISTVSKSSIKKGNSMRFYFIFMLIYRRKYCQIPYK